MAALTQRFGAVKLWLMVAAVVLLVAGAVSDRNSLIAAGLVLLMLYVLSGGGT